MEYKDVGYQYIINTLNLKNIQLREEQYVYSGSTRKDNLFPKKYWPGETIIDHLLFIIKYSYIDLSILYIILTKLDDKSLRAAILEKKSGQYIRRLWFYYEFLLSKNLDIPDLVTGNYLDLLDNSRYFTSSKIIKNRRYRLNINLLGNDKFCPIVRRSEYLIHLDTDAIKSKLESLSLKFNKTILNRALTYLYHKETKSSFEIEHEKPDKSRVERFVSLLTLAERDDFLTKEKLLELQNIIVDPRFRDSDYRTTQNYVGESISPFDEIVHFVSPRPMNINSLMEGLFTLHSDLLNQDSMGVILAAIVSYAFVFFHPFEDGNGRIHRFLIHNILSLSSFTPKGLMFPVSAVMLKSMDLYNNSLEDFSGKILPLIEYSLSDEGELTVRNDTEYLYKYMDLTFQAESLYKFIIETIDDELVKELNFLDNYDKAVLEIKEVVDLPGKELTLLMKFLLQNDYKLSNNKREKNFNFLTEEEIHSIEVICLDIFNC